MRISKWVVGKRPGWMSNYPMMALATDYGDLEAWFNAAPAKLDNPNICFCDLKKDSTNYTGWVTKPWDGNNNFAPFNFSCSAYSYKLYGEVRWGIHRVSLVAPLKNLQDVATNFVGGKGWPYEEEIRDVFLSFNSIKELLFSEMLKPHALACLETRITKSEERLKAEMKKRASLEAIKKEWEQR